MSFELRRNDALKLWQEVHLNLVREGGQDLSARQLAILLTVYLDTPPHTVRGLAARLGVTKPVISRALDTMGKAKLVARRRDEADRRNVIVQRTTEGEQAVDRLGGIILHRAKEIP